MRPSVDSLGELHQSSCSLFGSWTFWNPSQPGRRCIFGAGAVELHRTHHARVIGILPTV